MANICRWESPEQWSEWSEWLAAGLHARNRWRLPVLLIGILFASGRRTVTTWLRAAGVSDDFQDYFYFLSCVGRKSNLIATQLVILVLRTLPLPQRVLLVIDDSPTKRYGPKVEGADVHHNPTPGPADQPFLYGHVWVTISLALRHPTWGPLALPLRAMLYVRRRTMATIPKSRGWQRFATKLQLAARLVEWGVPLLKEAGKTTFLEVKRSRLRKFKIPLPPLEEQKRIVTYLNKVSRTVESLRKLQQITEKELEKLVPAILDKAFKGEL